MVSALPYSWWVCVIAGRVEPEPTSPSRRSSLRAVPLLGEPVSERLLIAGMFMMIGIWLHLTEQHSHEHRHDATTTKGPKP